MKTLKVNWGHLIYINGIQKYVDWNDGNHALTSMRKTSIMLEFYIFADFVPTDAYLSLQKISWHTNLNKITDNNTALLTHLHVWSVDKTKKEEKWNRLSGHVLSLSKKNWLSQLISWMN